MRELQAELAETGEGRDGGKGDCDMLCDVTDMERMPLPLMDE